MNQVSDGYVNGLKLGPKGTYIYRIKVAGKVRTGDTAMTRLFEAEQELIKIRANFLQSSMGIEKKKAPTFKACIDIWEKKKIGKKSDGYIQNTKKLMELHFIPFIGSKFVDKISKGDLEDCMSRYIIKSQKSKDCFGGYNKLIKLLGSILNVMKEDKYMSEFKLPDFQESQEKNYDVLNKKQLDNLFLKAEIKYGLTKTVALVMGTMLGLRASELTNALWNDVLWEAKKFKIPKAKNKKYNEIPMCDDLIYWLKKLKDEEDKIGLILTTSDGNTFDRHFLEYMLEDLGQKHFKLKLTAHSLRRSFITILHNAGTPPKTLQALARHASLAQTMKYVKIGELEKEKAINDVFNKKLS